MAGSYNHVVDHVGTGALYDAEGINGMLECNSGDVVECVEEMYGMIWALAEMKVAEVASRSPGYIDEDARARMRAEIVEEARLSYKEGLRLSPGTGASLPFGEDEGE